MNLGNRLVVIVAAIAMVAAACGASYDREAAISDLVEGGGIPRHQAECIIDGVEDSFGIERLESRGSLSAEDESVLTALTIECVLGGG